MTTEKERLTHLYLNDGTGTLEPQEKQEQKIVMVEDNEKPLSDEEFASKLAAQCYPISFRQGEIKEPQDVFFAGLVRGLAEGRKRNQAEAEARYPELTTLIPKMAEGEQCWLGHSASIALHQFIGQREEAAAREAWLKCAEDLNELFDGTNQTENFNKWWKQRKSQGGVDE